MQNWRNSIRNFTDLEHRKELVHGPTEVLADRLHPRRVHLAKGVDNNSQLLESGEFGFDLLQSLDGVDEVRVPRVIKAWTFQAISLLPLLLCSVCCCCCVLPT